MTDGLPEAGKLMLEAPECELGYTSHQLERILGWRLEAFNHWMVGQTGSICEGRRYNFDTKKYEPTGCGPHGMVVYGHDLRQFLRGGKPFD